MALMRSALGLDLGSHSLKAVELQQNLRGLDVVQMRTLPRPTEDLPLPELVRRFCELHRFTTEHVVAALPGERLSSRRLSFPFRERRRLLQAVPFAVEEELPFDLDDVVIDWAVVGGDRNRAEILAAIAARREVSELLAGLGEAGCAPRTLEAGGLVLANLCGVFELPGRRLLVDIGHRQTTFCLLVDESALLARTVLLGGRNLTDALAADRGLAPAEAERLKCEQGVLAAAPAPQALAVLDRWARETARTLGAAEPLLGGAAVEEITLLGGGAQLELLDQYLAERTGLPTARLGLPREGQAAGFVAGGPPIVFAPAIALALRATAQARTRMNFRRDEFALRLDIGRALRDFRTTGWLAAAALLLAVLGFGTSTSLDARRASALETQALRLYSEAFPGREAPGDPMAALREEVRSAQERADFLGVYRGNLSALDLLTELSQRVPADLEIGLEELSIDGQSVRMRVHAESFQAADRLGTELARFEPFAAARIGAIETDAKTGAKRFSVTISLRGAEERG